MPETGWTVALQEYVDRTVARRGGDKTALKPGHRQRFHWPPHPISYDFHVHPSDFSGLTHFEAYGESFPVKVARTPHGVFGRCEDLWHEDRGETDAEMLANLRASSEPLLARQRLINETLEQPGRFTGSIGDLDALSKLKLLYCSNRDVAHEARVQIEKRASDFSWVPALLFILADDSHPYRRSAQWCVLDLFESFPAFVEATDLENRAVVAIQHLMENAPDDHARTIYKAGVVLGGHLPYRFGGDALFNLLGAPSRIGRRAAIHGLYHVAEWVPDRKDEVVSALRAHQDEEPLLTWYAHAIAKDMEEGEVEHVVEPTFEDEER
jgi:hypothetical protein